MNGRPQRAPIIARAFGLVAMALWSGCGGDPDAPAEAERVEQSAERAGAGAGPAAPSAGYAEGADPALEAEDVRIFQATMERALRERLDTLAIGDRMVRLGRWFVGTEYTPHTLEVPGPERLVVNLRQLDCVTYLENMLAMARLLDSRSAPTFGDFLAELQRIRYRDGELEGYASRLHYFSEWISNNAELGLVRDVTQEIGGIPTDERIDFMSSNAEAYRQLESPEELDRIRAIERRLSARGRHYVPEARISEVAPRIRDGDIIAATSSIEGLDIAHTGMALWIDGRLHLMHAPLVGKDVQISEVPLSERILRIDGQDGIMVARPL